MPRSSRSPRQARLQQLLIEQRVLAGLTQVELAGRLKRPQSFVSKYENGERRLDVIELVEVAEGIGCRADELIAKLITSR
jgi:transcriptional regulator with XRE-family HTH domain